MCIMNRIRNIYKIRKMREGILKYQTIKILKMKAKVEFENIRK